MVNLTRIYTRTGDQGSTALGDMSRVAKTDLRISAYADANEANAVIGTAIALGGLDEEIVKVLTRVQNDLFDVGADLSTPVVENPEFPPLRVEQFYIDKLEADCDRFLAEVEKLRSFILPGGTPRGPAPPGLHGRTPGRTLDVGGAGGARRGDEPPDGDLPQPPLRPPVHPCEDGEQGGRGRAVGTGRGTVGTPRKGRGERRDRPRRTSTRQAALRPPGAPPATDPRRRAHRPRTSSPSRPS